MILQYCAIDSHKAVGQSFSGMETKMNEVGQTAIRIGELI